jgi:hypothetical protein
MSEVTDGEVTAALLGLGFTRIAACNEGQAVSNGDLRTDMRGALEAFLAYATTGETR